MRLDLDAKIWLQIKRPRTTPWSLAWAWAGAEALAGVQAKGLRLGEGVVSVVAGSEVPRRHSVASAAELTWPDLTARAPSQSK